eukprot:50725-Alexandrium_andersonii.AAC.1
MSQPTDRQLQASGPTGQPLPVPAGSSLQLARPRPAGVAPAPQSGGWQQRSRPAGLAGTAVVAPSAALACPGGVVLSTGRPCRRMASDACWLWSAAAE